MVRFNFPNEGLLKSKWISRGMLVTWPTSLHGLSMVFLLQHTRMQILHWDRCDSILWLHSFSYSVKKKTEIVSDVLGKFYYHGTTNGYFVLCYSWVTSTNVFVICTCDRSCHSDIKVNAQKLGYMCAVCAYIKKKYSRRIN